jgi:hypothetical protein
MTKRLSVEPAPGPLEEYAERSSTSSSPPVPAASPFAATWRGSCYRPNATRR